MQVTRHDSLELFSIEDPLILESGQVLPSVTVAYEASGPIHSGAENVILVCHALTGSARAAGSREEAGWWYPMIGPGKALDTSRYVVLCSNILGSCYGSTGPMSINPWTGCTYGNAFPVITVRDMVRVQKRLMYILGIRRLAAVIGSSLGGMQVLEWGVMYPDFCETLIPISVAARQPAWCLAWNAASRAAMRLHPEHGLAVARMIGMISYRSPREFEERFGRRKQHGILSLYDPRNLFEVESYLEHQGRKLVDRFDSETYTCLSRAMDLHDIARGRGELHSALGAIRARTLCIGVSSDVRYPVACQRELAATIPGAVYGEIESDHGHDAFLIEYEQLGSLVSCFLEEAEAEENYRNVSGWR